MFSIIFKNLIIWNLKRQTKKLLNNYNRGVEAVMEEGIWSTNYYKFFGYTSCFVSISGAGFQQAEKCCPELKRYKKIAKLYIKKIKNLEKELRTAGEFD